jgi:hypothetical protein
MESILVKLLGGRSRIILFYHRLFPVFVNTSMSEAYCMKEKAKREINSPHEVTLKNGRRALQGTCASCGTTLFKILGAYHPLALVTPA